MPVVLLWFGGGAALGFFGAKGADAVSDVLKYGALLGGGYLLAKKTGVI